jgi:hypothetical protein
MEVEVVLRGYQSRVRDADWQKANTLPDEQLTLTREQRDRAQLLQIPEHAYAVRKRAAEFAGDHAMEKITQLAQLIADTIARRYPEGELRSIVWDFVDGKFQFVFWQRMANREVAFAVPGELVDEVILEVQGADQRLLKSVDVVIGGGLMDAMNDGEPHSGAA